MWDLGIVGKTRHADVTIEHVSAATRLWLNYENKKKKSKRSNHMLLDNSSVFPPLTYACSLTHTSQAPIGWYTSRSFRGRKRQSWRSRAVTWVMIYQRPPNLINTHLPETAPARPQGLTLCLTWNGLSNSPHHILQCPRDHSQQHSQTRIPPKAIILSN